MLTSPSLLPAATSDGDGESTWIDGSLSLLASTRGGGVGELVLYKHEDSLRDKSSQRNEKQKHEPQELESIPILKTQEQFLRNTSPLGEFD